jgi:hypothetical protein
VLPFMAMTLRSSVVLLVAVALSTTAFAQDDDDLAPLAPLTPIGKPKPRAKPKPKAKPQPRARPAPVADDELAPIAPIAAKGDLTVKVASSLAGSILSIDGKEVGALPLPPQNIPSGEHTVTVKRPGYAAFVKKVQIPGGKSVEVEAKLTAVSAVLSVTSDVPGAQVLLNGRSIGIVPLNDVEVPPGPAEVAVIKEGFREETQKINFAVGKEYPIVVKFNAVAEAASDRPVSSKLTPNVGTGNPVTGVALAPEEPITSKWYFWAGIAAGAVAAVAIGVSVGVGSQPPPLNENGICGEGGCDGCIGITCAAGIRPMGSF